MIHKTLAAGFLALALLLGTGGCGDSEEYTEPTTDDTFPGTTFNGSGIGDGFSEPFYVAGGNIQFQVTHGDDTRFALHIIRQSTGEVIDSIVYMNAVTDATVVKRFATAGDYRLEIDTDAGSSWQVSVTGNIQTYANPFPGTGEFDEPDLT